MKTGTVMATGKIHFIVPVLQPRRHFVKVSNIAGETFWVNVAHYVANGKEAKHFFASELQILCLQDMLLGYSNEETCGKHLKSVLLQCFSKSIPCLRPPRNGNIC